MLPLRRFRPGSADARTKERDFGYPTPVLVFLVPPISLRHFARPHAPTTIRAVRTGDAHNFITHFVHDYALYFIAFTCWTLWGRIAAGIGLAARGKKGS